MDAAAAQNGWLPVFGMTYECEVVHHAVARVMRAESRIQLSLYDSEKWLELRVITALVWLTLQPSL